MSTPTPRARVSHLSAMERKFPRSAPARPSEHIAHLRALVDAHGPGLRVVLLARESYLSGKTRRRLDSQIRAMRREIEALGCIVVGELREQCAGYSDPLYERVALLAAMLRARREGAVLVARDMQRLLRPMRYGLTRNDAEPLTELDFERLNGVVKEAGGDLQMATILHPDATPEEIASNRICLGLAVANRQPGRPQAKKKRREKLKPEAERLYAEGISKRAISKKLRVPRQTIQDWLR